MYLEHLGSRVRQAAAVSLAQQLPAAVIHASSSEPEIGQLDEFHALQQHVLALDVPVRYVVPVQIVHGLAQLPNRNNIVTTDVVALRGP
jgi:hypothetical protein